MTCKVCQKSLSLLRRLNDQEYCSDEHRAAGTKRSASALRDVEGAEYETAATWDVAAKKASPVQDAEGLWSYTQTALLSILALTGILFLAIQFSGSTYQGERAKSGQTDWLSPIVTSLFGRETTIPEPVRLYQDFSAPDLKEWTPLAGGANWSIRNGLMQPGGLRLWQESRTMVDYRFQFEGSIESSSLSWAVRAVDHRNYQASKMVIRGDRSSSTNELVRFTVIDGKEMARIRIPIPVQLRPHAFHHYEVRATGNHLLTYLDGKLVDSYIDPRLSSGGVGFFTEARERSAIRWVRLLPGREFTDQLRSYFSFGLDLPFLK